MINRRQLLKCIGLGSLVAAIPAVSSASTAADSTLSFKGVSTLLEDELPVDKSSIWIVNLEQAREYTTEEFKGFGDRYNDRWKYKGYTLEEKSHGIFNATRNLAKRGECSDIWMEIDIPPMTITNKKHLVESKFDHYMNSI